MAVFNEICIRNNIISLFYSIGHKNPPPKTNYTASELFNEKVKLTNRNIAELLLHLA